MIAEHRHLVDQGAKLVELRLDYINGEVNLKRLIADRPSAVPGLQDSRRGMSGACSTPMAGVHSGPSSARKPAAAGRSGT